MLRAAKFRLYPTPAQEKFLWGQWGAVRFVWNKALALKQRFWKRNGTNLSIIHDLKPLIARARRFEQDERTRPRGMETKRREAFRLFIGA